MALGATTELSLRFRQQRGQEGIFSGSPTSIEESIFADLFYDRDWKRTVSISLSGNSDDNRSVRIVRGGRDSTLTLGEGGVGQYVSSVPFLFVWKDATGKEYPLTPHFANNTVQFPSTGEELPKFFYFASNNSSTANENAALYSQLSKSFKDKSFNRMISKQFRMVKDISIEISGGVAALHATVPGLEQKLPLTSVSGAINRLLGILLSMAARPGGILLVDEMENGVYYSHHRQVWDILLLFAKIYDYQIFTTTHSKEWLVALIDVASSSKSVSLEDIRLWRVERERNKPIVLEFNGQTLRHGINYGEEPRGKSVR